VVARLSVLRESIDLESSQLLQRTVTEFLERGYLESHLEALNAANRVRRDSMLAALDRELGGLADWTEPQGGLFLWLTLADGVDTGALLPAAFERQVAFIPGANFSAEGRYTNALRLNYSNAKPERIQEGILRLASVIRGHGMDQLE
jgi:2-aminoadipate transaminase